VAARLAGVRVLVHRTALTDDVSDAPGGTIVQASGDTLAVAAGDGRVLRIVSLQPEGRRVMSVRDFLASRRIEPGEPVLPA
jgi:methionyl-tRNA formyltransferase